MKTILITIFFLSFNIFNSTAQEFKIDTKNNFEIPVKFKSKDVYSAKKMETYTFETKYFKEINGYITTVFDASGKVILLTISENSKNLNKGFFLKGGSTSNKSYPEEVIQNCKDHTSGWWAFVGCVIAAL